MAKSSRKGKNEPPRAPPTPRSRAPWGLALLLVVPAVALVWLLRGGTRRAPDEPEPPAHPAAARSAREARGRAAATASAAKRGGGGAGGDALSRPAQPGERPGMTEESVEGKSPAEKRLLRARATLDNYLESTRYPFTSQPLSRHADVAIPNFVPSVKLPLSRPDKKPTDAKVTVGQDRAFVHGAESVTLRITCENSEGPQPCVFEKPPMAFVRKDQRGADAISPSPVPFVPDGGDPSNQIAHFTPAKQGFAAYDGQIAIEGQLKVGSDDGGVSWQITYTRAPPAVFTKKTREVMENGSLSIYVGMTVEKPGRYVVTARAFSKDKKGFGYLQFNDELPRGATEAKLVVFGKLVHDEKAETPFEIRDVEGFLLRDGGHPDREIMAMLPGTVLTTKTYPLKDFSEATWSSEEKDRHLAHYKEEIDTAKADVDKEQSAGAAGSAPLSTPRHAHLPRILPRLEGYLAPLVVYLVVLVLHLAVPARRTPGYVTDAAGAPLRYRLNGLVVCLLTVGLWALACRRGLLAWDFFYVHRWQAAASACALGLVFTLAIVLPAPRVKESIQVRRRRPEVARTLLADLYLGRLANPQWREGLVDAKMFLYLVGAVMLLLNVLSFAAHHVLTHATDPSPGVFLYAALFAFFVCEYLFFERVHLYTYDFFAERVGFKLGWGCLVFYPFFYGVGLWGTAELPNPHTPLPLLALYGVVFFSGWALSRGANLQKFFFKLDPGRKAFGVLAPEVVEADGKRLLCSGFWRVSRHVNYLGEILMATGLALSLGHPTAIAPWLYPLYYVALLVPRERDDDRRCAEKYGPLWDAYKKRVPWRIVPGVY